MIPRLVIIDKDLRIADEDLQNLARMLLSGGNRFGEHSFKAMINRLNAAETVCRAATTVSHLYSKLPEDAPSIGILALDAFIKDWRYICHYEVSRGD